MSKQLEQILGEKYAIYSVLPIAERRGFLIGYNLREEEIKKLTKEITELKHENGTCCKGYIEKKGSIELCDKCMKLFTHGA